MLGMKELKGQIETNSTTVKCPVKNCSIVVERQRQHFKRENGFKCPTHNIYISPSTFEYEHYTDNLLWKDPEEIQLLESIFKEKRESRMARDNSEDAVTWNVFRFLEKNNLTERFLTSITGTPQEKAEIIYWSYSHRERKSWPLLNKARKEFGEAIRRGSEPDIIIDTDKAIFFIEAKLTAGNNTPSDEKQIGEKIRNPKKYKTGGNDWFGNVFGTSYEEIVRKQKYELLRFWLLGTWMAAQTLKTFCLINLVREEAEEDIEPVFRKHIKENPERKFGRLTWEEICKFASDQDNIKDKGAITAFFNNKSIGYNKDGQLQKAFSNLE